MKSLLTWLKQKLSPSDSTADPYRGRPAPRISPAQRRRKPPVQVKKAKRPQMPSDFENPDEGPGRIVDGGPGKNILVSNRHERADTGTQGTLKIVDDAVPKPEEAAEFDPYNTGRFDRSKTWDAPTRKK